jgi:hypothetical protein
MYIVISLSKWYHGTSPQNLNFQMFINLKKYYECAQDMCSQSLEFSGSKQRHKHMWTVSFMDCLFVILFMLGFSIFFLDMCSEFDYEILGITSSEDSQLLLCFLGPGNLNCMNRYHCFIWRIYHWICSRVTQAEGCTSSKSSKGRRIDWRARRTGIWSSQLRLGTLERSHSTCALKILRLRTERSSPLSWQRRRRRWGMQVAVVENIFMRSSFRPDGNKLKQRR